MDEQTKADIQWHLKKLRIGMLKEIEDDIDKKLEQFKQDIINTIEQKTKPWSKAIYDRAWQKGKKTAERA